MAASSLCHRICSVRRLLARAHTHLSRDGNTSMRYYSHLVKGKSVKIGCASGFWGDTAVAAPQLIYGSKVDFIVFDYLSEITMSLLTAARRKAPNLGYAPDFVQVSMAPFIKDIKRKGIKIISNAGGVNPHGCAAALQEVCSKEDISLNIAVVDGDDLMSQLPELQKLGITEMDSGMELPKTVHSMNAYLGSGPIARALNLGADVVITGRCTDSALVLGPLVHTFGWKMDQFDLLASGSLAGHLIECGAQVTGGVFTDWHSVPNWDDIGFPVVECGEDGEFLVTKPPNTGGLVSKATVAEQLLYEIGDPAHYFLPDVVCDFSNVTLDEVGENAIHVSGARGNPPSGEFKVSATYMDGYRSTAVVFVGGPRAAEKVEKTANAVLKRCQRIFSQLQLQNFSDINMEVFSTDHLYGPQAKSSKNVREAVMWLAVHHSQRKALDFFTREVAPAGTGMAPGLCNIAGGRPKVSPVLKLFSFLYPRDNFNINISMNGEHVEGYVVPTGPTAEYLKRAYPPHSADEQEMPKLPQGEFSYRLEDLAYTRSGDKGNSANIGVIARHPLFLPYIKQALTAEAVEQYFSHLFPDRIGPVCSRVKRFDAPGIHGINFLLTNALGGGGIASLRSDAQGKALGQILLDFELTDVPDLQTMAQELQA
ncbi:uncharacterized protein LOC124139613 isoform X1 [Haliotis rufescens]|uniref:uncharacterized protein LOC124139613 isoform X1 n=2 Tax=Haliotis rufescens TaxID=6454 RepID=UPI00201EE022|nr:uncharacterized protein LOC124139613 isoform X1 [Haliotis rufescens]